MRKLATIERIEEVQPIEDADNIEKVRVKGWWVVVRKADNFKIGDKCVYFEIDSLLPVRNEFSFLLAGASPKKMLHDGKEVEGIRLRTKKLRGQISQGLVMPMSSFPELGNDTEVGFDYSETLNVLKYEMPVPSYLEGILKGEFPGFMPKTDEERIQNVLDTLEKYKGRHFYVTEKIDGTSCSIYKYNNEFGVCSRGKEWLDDGKNTLWKMANKYNLKELLPDGFVVQSEIIGEGIQDNRLKQKGQDLYVFYVYDIEKAEYLTLEEMEILTSKLGLKTVPITEMDFVMERNLDDLLNMADRNSILNPNQPAEGLVFRLRDNNKKISFKVISNEYLLKWGL